jgi:hypothetical protein
MTLVERIIAAVRARPGILTFELALAVKTRKAVVLAELERLQQEHVVRSEPRPRGGRAWYLAEDDQRVPELFLDTG